MSAQQTNLLYKNTSQNDAQSLYHIHISDHLAMLKFPMVAQSPYILKYITAYLHVAHAVLHNYRVVQLILICEKHNLTLI